MAAVIAGMVMASAASCSHAPSSFRIHIPANGKTLVLQQDLYRQTIPVHMARSSGVTSRYAFQFDVRDTADIHYAFLTIDTLDVRHPQNRVLLNGNEIGFLPRADYQGAGNVVYAGDDGPKQRIREARFQRYLPATYLVRGRNELVIESQPVRSARLGGAKYSESYTINGVNFALFRVTAAAAGEAVDEGGTRRREFPPHFAYFNKLTDDELYIALVKLPFLLGELTQPSSIYANSLSYVYARIGDYYRWTGRYHRSLVYEEKAVARQATEPLTLLTPLIRTKLALAHYHLGRYDAAIADCEQALAEIDVVAGGDLRQTGGSQMEDPEYLRSLVFAYLSMNYYHVGDGDQSGYYARRVITGFDDNWMAYVQRQMPIGHYLPVALADQTLGDIALRDGRLDAALGHYENARTHLGYEQRPEIFHDQMIIVLLGLARVHYGAGAPGKALEILDAVERPTNAFLWRADLLRGMIHESQGRLAEAVTWYGRSIEEIEHARSRLTSHGMKINFMADKQKPYARMVHCMAEMGRHAEAFGFAEKAKARAFLDLLSGSERLVGRKNAVLDEITQEEAQLRQHLLDIQHKMDMDRTVFQTRGDDPAAAAQLRQARGALTRFLSRWFSQNKDFASLRSADTLSVDAVQALLPDGVALVEYYYDDTRLYAWIIEGDRFQMVSKPVAADTLVSLCRSFRQAFGQPSTARGMAVVVGPGKTVPMAAADRQLEALLVDHILDHVVAEKVFIVPHGALHYLPFQALRIKDHYLIETLQIGYMPSASMLKYIFDKKSDADRKIFALGNPDLGADAMGLPHARAEVEEISRLFAGTTVLTGKSASEAAFKQNAAGYTILHIASHGEFNPEAPLLSCLRLSPGSGEDGRLETQEIFDLDLHADLVALSACNTALGRMGQGDELTGLTRAFLFAGTPSILGTFWSVNDASTRALMREFYTNLKTMDKFAALQRAQVTLIHSDAFNQPYQWAAFQLIGDYR